MDNLKSTNAFTIFKNCIDDENYIINLNETIEEDVGLNYPIILAVSIQENYSCNSDTNIFEKMIPNFGISEPFSKIYITIFYNKIDKIRNITCSNKNIQSVFFDKVNKKIYFICKIDEKGEDFIKLINKLDVSPKPAKR